MLVGVLFAIGTQTLHAQPPYNCQCPGDFNLCTTCIEIKVEPVPSSVGCFNVIVYNHQWDNTETPPCSAYDAEQYLSFKFKNQPCWEDNNVSVILGSYEENTSYSPPQSKWVWADPLATIYTQGFFHSTTDTPHYPQPIIFKRRDNFGGASNPMRRCEVDTFRLCIGCKDNIPDSCVNAFDMEVYFSDANGNSTCTEQANTGGKQFNVISLQPPLCSGAPAGCDTGCTLYLSSCNTYNVTWGCDYADVEIINDHAYPMCQQITEFDMSFAATGMGICDNDPVLSEGLPTFRDWKTVYDPTSGHLIFRAPPGCGLKTCDTFRVRIPFCCESQKEAGLIFGKGLCGAYSQVVIDTTITIDPGPPPTTITTYDTTYINYPGSAGTGGMMSWNKFDDEPGCEGCYYDKDKAVIHEALQCASDTNNDGICDIYWEDPSGCDTLILFNRNHAPGVDCGDDATGNKCWSTIELQLDNTKGRPCVSPQAPTLPPPPFTTIAEIPVGSGKWIINTNPPICGCQQVPIIICCYNGRIDWTTKDANGVIISSDSLRVNWSSHCPGASVPVQMKPTQLQTPDIATAAGHTLGHPAPNPTTGRISVPLNVGELSGESGEVRISIYNDAGSLIQVVRQQVSALSGTDLDLDASGWTNGNYYVYVELNGALLTTRFVLRK